MQNPDFTQAVAALSALSDCLDKLSRAHMVAFDDGEDAALEDKMRRTVIAMQSMAALVASRCRQWLNRWGDGGAREERAAMRLEQDGMVRVAEEAKRQEIARRKADKARRRAMRLPAMYAPIESIELFKKLYYERRKGQDT